MEILCFNHKAKECGVYQYGFRLFSILKKDSRYKYFEVERYDEYKEALDKHPEVRVVIFNYNCMTMSWLNRDNIIRKIKNIGIPHEALSESMSLAIFDYTCSINPSLSNGIPRPLYEDVDLLLKDYTPSNDNIKQFIDYKEEGVPVFGSFGFAFMNKAFHKIVDLVNKSYDRAIIKLSLSMAHFDPGKKENLRNVISACLAIERKPGIKLMITNEFFSNEDLLKFLSSNDMNVFLYERDIEAPSSVLDYALAVKKSIAISTSPMFRNVYHDSICPYKTSMQDCMANSVSYCERFLQEYSHANLRAKFDQIITSLI